MVFRAESLFTWDEYVRVNRHTDEDDDSDDGAAAEHAKPSPCSATPAAAPAG